MTQNINHKAAKPNPALESLRVLVGEWRIVGAHQPWSTVYPQWHEGFRRFLALAAQIPNKSC